jgi:hypothetical protein
MSDKDKRDLEWGVEHDITLTFGLASTSSRVTRSGQINQGKEYKNVLLQECCVVLAVW